MTKAIVTRGLWATSAMFLCASAGHAQTAAQSNAQAAKQPSAASATAAPDPEKSEQEIVVTARRTEENIQRVPSAISAFNERSLDRLQATDTTGLQGAVPNLNIVQGRGSSNATNIFIRGIGQPDALQTFDPAVGVYVDDVYLSRIRGNQLDLLDLERIEVLRGPQGTLYGKNTIGGAIKFVSRKPGQDFRANGSIALGSYDQIDFKAAVSGPLSSNLALGVAAIRSLRDGYVRDSIRHTRYNDKDSIGGRAALAFTPSSKVRLDLTADYSQDDSALQVGRPVNNLISAFGVVLPVSNAVGTGSYNWRGRTTPGLPNSTKLTHWGAAATLAVDLTDQLTFKSISAYRNLKTDDYVDIDASQYKLGDVFVGVRQHQTSQEFQFIYSGNRLSGVAGLYYLDERIKSHQEAYADDFLRFSKVLPPFKFTRFVDDDLRTKSYAAFVNGSYEVVSNVRVSAGLRYTKETKDYQRSTIISSTFAPLNNTGFVFLPPKGKWSDWSPMASVDWQALPHLMFYARAAKGFKSGGFNGRANSVGEASAYKPETVWSYEAGFKSRFANQLTLNGAAFTSDYKDFQARISGSDDISGIPTPVLSVLNAGKLRISGAELEAAWTPLTGLLIDGQLGYLDAKYKKFADARFPGGSRAFQTPAFAPKWTLRLGAQYAIDFGNAGSITIGGQTRYKSRTALAVDNTFVIGSSKTSGGTTTEVEGLFQKGYWTEDARIVYETEGKHFAFGLYGNNLSNRAYKTDAQEFSSVGNIRTVYYGAPRTVTFRFTARY